MKKYSTTILSLFLLWTCEQTPNSLEVSTNTTSNNDTSDSLYIAELEYSFSSNQFFVSSYSPSDDSVSLIWYNLESLQNELWTLEMSAFVRDNGSGFDRIPGDQYFDHEFSPALFSADSLSEWRIRLTAGEKNLTKMISLETPLPPIIVAVFAPDTLWLSTSGYRIDTLQVEVSHPKGLDEIRSVTFKSKKPGTSTYTQPFDLYDDGGNTTLFNIGDTLFLNSNDKKAGDGIWSFPIALDPSGNTGTNYWLFQAQSWNGQISTFEDSLVIMLPLTMTIPNDGVVL